MKREIQSFVARALGTAIAIWLLGAVASMGQTNLMPPAPPGTNWVHRNFQRPVMVKSQIEVWYEYTNISYPFYYKTNLEQTNWLALTNVSCTQIKITQQIDTSVAEQYFQAGPPTYNGLWTSSTN